MGYAGNTGPFKTGWHPRQTLASLLFPSIEQSSRHVRFQDLEDSD